MPEIAGFTKHRPTDGEDALSFLERLRASTTPEDAVTYSAFAAQPSTSIAWGVESVRITLPDMSADDLQMLAWITQWIDNPVSETRWRVMRAAMYAPRRTAVVYLGLAVGWSGGALAPNDPITAPAWRTPKAVNAAILRAIGQVGIEQRSVSLARILDLAAGLFRVY
ncbi:hypothetical protein KDD17_17275 [Sulfitobacter albidus]|uniref:Uncharacterized protein n=1 Tax=Sulfitobacter albidus TaxID=2829501 RepID=A0A975JGS2_9RHOB|nr:hypothetical protein [Sulfitobacter albidus]QUJ78241.1 hypothetical protein KDD17_17275 [Sulfitobacter albidus]